MLLWSGQSERIVLLHDFFQYFTFLINYINANIINQVFYFWFVCLLYQNNNKLMVWSDLSLSFVADFRLHSLCIQTVWRPINCTFSYFSHFNAPPRRPPGAALHIISNAALSVNAEPKQEATKALILQPSVHRDAINEAYHLMSLYRGQPSHLAPGRSDKGHLFFLPPVPPQCLRWHHPSGIWAGSRRRYKDMSV